MLKLIYELPEQIADAQLITKKIESPAFGRVNSSSVSNIVISGMGGSGIGGDILQGLLSYYSSQPVLIVKDYSLPKFVTGQSLFFAVSHSGDTEETIAAYEAAKKIKCPIICITSGGKLLDLAVKASDVLVRIPRSLPPRTAIGYLFIPFLILLNKLGLIKNFNRDISETIKVLIDHRKSYQTQAQRLAKKMVGKIPFIYATSRLLSPVANRWRAEFNELAKVVAHTGCFPELNHNEIVGLGGPAVMKSLTYLLILLDPNGEERNKLRVDLTLKIVKGSYYKAQQFLPDGKSPLTKIFSLVMQGDLLSYYLALARKVDPLPVTRIDKLKELMARH